MSADIHTHVRQLAEELKANLESIRRAAGFDADWNHAEKSQLTEIEEDQVASVLNHCLIGLAETGIMGPENQLPSQILWKVVGSELKHGSLQLRAREKPRGYAGDDVLLRKIHEQAVCHHPLGRAFDRFFQMQDAPTAVRGRIRIASEVIQRALECVLYDVDFLPELPVSVIGAGPAIEVLLAMQNMQQKKSLGLCLMKTVLFDLDEAALLNAEQRLKQLFPDANIQTIRENLFRLAKQPRRAKALRISRAILCLGLMDYLSDEDASELLSLCWRNLDQQGHLLVGNFSPQCRARTYMEWIGNWYLNYRTTEEFFDLAVQAGIPEKRIRIEADPTGVNLLLKAERF